MSVLLLAVGLALLALPGALGRVGGRVAPSEWCRAVLACLRVGQLAVRSALVLAALPVVLQAVGAHEVAHVCHLSVTAGLPLPPAIGGLPAALLAVSLARSASTRWHDAAALGRLRVEPWLGRHRVDRGVEVVTVPCVERLAYAVPGRPDQVVLSDGLLAVLEPDEADAVLRHERAHLRHGHHDALVVARDLESWMGWYPPAGASVAALRLAVERWADEEAGAGSAGARPAVRRALVKVVALAIAPAPAFSDAHTIAARLDALAATPPAPSLRVRIAATVPMIGLYAFLLGALLACALVAHEGLDGFLGHCPF